MRAAFQPGEKSNRRPSCRRDVPESDFFVFFQDVENKAQRLHGKTDTGLQAGSANLRCRSCTRPEPLLSYHAALLFAGIVLTVSFCACSSAYFTMGVYVNEILYSVGAPEYCILHIFLFKNEK